MKEWYCFKCKEKMEKAEIETTFMEFDGTAEALKCPQCGAIYLTEFDGVNDLVPHRSSTDLLPTIRSDGELMP